MWFMKNEKKIKPIENPLYKGWPRVFCLSTLEGVWQIRGFEFLASVAVNTPGVHLISVNISGLRTGCVTIQVDSEKAYYDYTKQCIGVLR